MRGEESSIDPQIARRMAGHDPHDGHDTGGVPWHGRDLSPNPFSQDTGEPDPAVVEALTGDRSEREVVEVLQRSRFFVPVVAAPGDGAEAGTDSVADMATVVLTSPEGERALPVFTSLASLADWDPAARPVPVAASTLGMAAAQESCDAILVDLGQDHARVLRASMIYAFAEERAWVPAHEDVVVGESLGRARDAVRADPRWAAALVDLRPAGLAPTGDLVVEVLSQPGLDRSDLHAMLAAVGERLAADADLRVRIDGVRFSVLAAR